MTSTFSHAINRPGANVRKGSDEGPAVKTLEMEASHDIPTEPVTVSQRKNWDPGSETSPLLEENTSLSGLAGKSGRGAQPGLRGNRPSLPFLLPSSGGRDCKMPHYKLKRLVEKHGQGKKNSFEPESNQRPKDC
ncbi:unnamed protein product [Leuciscus chuanchicus]